MPHLSLKYLFFGWKAKIQTCPKLYSRFLPLTFLFVFISCKNERSDSAQKPDNVFSDRVQEKAKPELSQIKLNLIPLHKSGITFNNKLNDEGGLNPFVWNFIYSGGGVATGDLDNDGLPDIYFGGNQVSDQVYKNEGDFQFKNMSGNAGITDELWSTGVFMADVNNDGWLDIYVCKTSYSIDPEKNRNKLFINKGNFRFEEQAQKYGIDDIGFSTHASFFDVDNDGDLDLYVVNQPIDAFSKYLYDANQVNKYAVSDHLYINEGGNYKIANGTYTVETNRYGLGISIGDLDWNGFTDVYIGSDYHHPDLMLSNNGKGFKNILQQSLGHQSFFSMGTDIADVNNDGWLDLITLDMAFEDHKRAKTNMASMSQDRFWNIVNEGGYYQYGMNALQINKGNGTFVECAQLAGVAKTDWSWSPLFVDLDSDGRQDLLVTNGILKDMQNNDFNDYVKSVYNGQVGPQNFQEVMTHLTSYPIGNKIYKNKGHFKFDDISTIAGFEEKGFSNGLAYADFNLDGKVDIVINNLNHEASVYQNSSEGTGHYLSIKLTGSKNNIDGLGTSLVAYSKIGTQAATIQTTRGYCSSSEPLIHLGFGRTSVVDSIKIFWNEKEMTLLTNIKTDQKLTVKYENSEKIRPQYPMPAGIKINTALKMDFAHQEVIFDDFEKQVLLPYKLSQNGPFMAKADVNGDGLEDFFIGGATGQSGQIFIQNGTGGFNKSPQKSLQSDAAHEDMEAIFFDAEGDADMDLFVVSGSNEIEEQSDLLLDRLYINDGRGNFTRSKQRFPVDHINGQTVVAFDFDQDGDMDLFVGGRLVSGQYPFPPSSAIYRNEKGAFKNVTKHVAPWLLDFELITDAKMCDINKDGRFDLILVGEWMKPTLAINTGTTFEKVIMAAAPSGIWWSVETADFDEDGDVDFVLGNLGENNKYYARNENRLKIFAGDMDGNGDHDLMLASLKSGSFMPIRGRECTSQELPVTLNKFPTYDAFSQADIQDILPASGMAEILEKEVTSLSHAYLENKGNLSFEYQDLPTELQTGVIKDFYVDDINEDGHLDFVYIGNHFPTEVETPRFDGLLHGICFGKGDGSFEVKIVLLESQPAALDLRNMISMNRPNHPDLWLISQNNGPLLSFIK